MKNKIEILLYGHLYKKMCEKYMLSIRERYDLRQVDLEIMYLLYSAGDNNTARDIGSSHLFTKGHISQSVGRLEQRKLIDVVSDEQDRRCTHLRLTSDADCIVKEIIEARKQMYDVIFEGITDEEQRILGRIINKIEANMLKQ